MNMIRSSMFTEIYNNTNCFLITVQDSEVHCTALYNSALHCTALHSTIQFCTALHSSAVQCCAVSGARIGASGLRRHTVIRQRRGKNISEHCRLLHYSLSQLLRIIFSLLVIDSYWFIYSFPS